MTDYATRRTMMVDGQVRPADVTKFPIIQAMLHLPRERFVPSDLAETAYMDDNLTLGPGRVIAAPRTLAKMLDALNIGPRDLVLDIGCGLGYSTAVAARLAEAVVGVEEDADIAAEAPAALASVGADNAAITQAPLTEGDPASGPFDVLLIQGGIELFPDTLRDRLKEGGRAAALFMDGPLGVARLGLRQGDHMVWRDIFNAAAPVLPGFARAPAFTF